MKEQNNKTKEIKNNKTRLSVFYVAVALIVIAIIALIILGVVKIFDKKEPIVGGNTEVLDGESVNPDANPEDMPSIAGNSNVDEINGVRVNNSSALKSDKKCGEYVFSNISLEAASGGTVMTAKVSAPSVNEKLSGKDIVINFYNKEGKLISIMNSYVGQIKPGETIEFRAESTSDLANAYDIKIEIK